MAWLAYHYTFRALATILPRRLVYRLAEPLFQVRFHHLRSVAECNLSASQVVPPNQVSRTARECITRFAESEVDNLLLMNPAFDEGVHCASIGGLQYLDQACTSGAGVMLLSAHLWATRLGKRVLAKRGYSILTVRRRHEVPEAASQFHRRVISPRHPETNPAVIGEAIYVQQPDCALQAFQRLRAGGIVNIPLDGSWGQKCVPSRLLGEEWNFPSGYFDLIRLSGCSVIPMLCTGNSSGLRIELFEPVKLVRSANSEQFIAANLPRLVSIIERHIRENPAEWMRWIHN